MVSSDEPSSSPSGDSTSTSRKTASRNSCKKLREIQWSDQKLWPFRAVLMVSSDETSPHRVAIQHLLQEKQRPGTRLKF
jgi:hypothetical protein